MRSSPWRPPGCDLSGRVGDVRAHRPMRNPIVLAKQVATLDVLTGGRLSLGVGVGWLAEEFAVLGAPFAGRGKRLDDWIAILRECWTGRPRPHDYEHWTVPPGVVCYPTPLGEIPILIGGMSPAAMRRAGRQAEGWVAFQYSDEIDAEVIAEGRRFVEAEAASVGRHPPCQTCPPMPWADRTPGRATARLDRSGRYGGDSLGRLDGAGRDSRESGDAEAGSIVTGQAGGPCRSGHSVYRGGDPCPKK